MRLNKMDRRQFALTAATSGVAALVPGACAQRPRQSAQSPIPPAAAEADHIRTLETLSSALDGAPLNTREGLHRVVALLRDHGLFSSDDAEIMNELIDAIFSAPESVAKEVQALYDRVRGKAGDLATAIVGIAKSSVDFAEKHERAIFIVSSDVAGALTGAATCLALGPLAIVAAVAGAVAGSAGADFATKK